MKEWKSMDPRSEVVLRQIDLLDGEVLFINPPRDSLLKQLPSPITGQVWTWNFADHQYFLGQQITSHFLIECPTANFDQAVIFVPKSRELLDYLLNQVLSQIKLGAQIFLVGEKKGGVERAAKQLQVFGKAIKIDSARHCQMWQMQSAQQPERKALQDWLKTYTVHTAHKELSICALPGVFSQKQLDIGTAVLLPYLTQVKAGKIADFGCGAGVISCYLASLNPENQIYALDVDAFALASTQLTFEINQLNPERLQVLPVTGIADAPDDLDAIVSNPPFHQGIHTDYDASEQLCQQAKQHLKLSGELWIVANRFLNYSPLLERSFGQCQILTNTQGFKVLYASVKY